MMLMGLMDMGLSRNIIHGIKLEQNSNEQQHSFSS